MDWKQKPVWISYHWLENWLGHWEMHKAEVNITYSIWYWYGGNNIDSTVILFNRKTDSWMREHYFSVTEVTFCKTLRSDLKGSVLSRNVNSVVHTALHTQRPLDLPAGSYRSYVANGQILVSIWATGWLCISETVYWNLVKALVKEEIVVFIESNILFILSRHTHLKV